MPLAAIAYAIIDDIFIDADAIIFIDTTLTLRHCHLRRHFQPAAITLILLPLIIFSLILIFAISIESFSRHFFQLSSIRRRRFHLAIIDDVSLLLSLLILPALFHAFISADAIAMPHWYFIAFSPPLSFHWSLSVAEPPFLQHWAFSCRLIISTLLSSFTPSLITLTLFSPLRHATLVSSLPLFTLMPADYMLALRHWLRFHYAAITPLILIARYAIAIIAFIFRLAAIIIDAAISPLMFHYAITLSPPGPIISFSLSPLVAAATPLITPLFSPLSPEAASFQY